MSEVLFVIVKTIMKVYYFFMYRVEIIGLEHIPKTGRGVLCCNHYCNLDPFTAAIYLKRLPRFIAKKELFRYAVPRALFTGLQAIPIDREAAMDMKAFKSALKVLKSEELLGIFAEGTRVKAGQKVEAKAGVSVFAIKGEAPIIPMAISGSYKFRSKLTLHIGEPMWFEEYRVKGVSSEQMMEMTGKVMQRIEELKVIEA